ncbi:MAG TPA: hypothetical protein VIJ86_07345 [Acidimicrobiales bacterium]
MIGACGDPVSPTSTGSVTTISTPLECTKGEHDRVVRQENWGNPVILGPRVALRDERDESGHRHHQRRAMWREPGRRLNPSLSEKEFTGIPGPAIAGDIAHGRDVARQWAICFVAPIGVILRRAWTPRRNVGGYFDSRSTLRKP